MHRKSRTQKTDIDRLNAWFDQHGHAAWSAIFAEGLEYWTVARILSGETECPRKLTRIALLRATGIPENELFISVGAEKKAAS
jgi:hypothetical protein